MPRRPLAERSERRCDSIARFRSAAVGRYRDADALFEAGRRLGAIYLYGYTAEMLLKAAYFRLAGRAPDDPIERSHLDAAKRHATRNLGLTWTGNFHDLGAWVDLLVHERRSRGAPHPPAVARELPSRVYTLYANWRESIRYDTARPSAREAAETRGSAAWLLRRYPEL